MQNTTLKEVLSYSVDAGAPECLVFSEVQHPRLKYTCEFIFNKVLAIRFRISSSRDEYFTHQGLKINYSHAHLKEGLQIEPQGLVFENDLNERQPEFTIDNGLQKVFVHQTAVLPGTLNFDVFAMVFYFISRYEEWQQFEEDEHGRFGVRQSILFRNKVLHRPIVDLCIQEVKEKLSALFPKTVWPKTSAKMLSTLDIDNLFAFKGRPLWKTCAAGIRDLIRGDYHNFSNRWKVLSGKQKDPFDIYDEVSGFCEKERIPLVFFFLYRNGTRYDRGIKPGSPFFIEVFQRLKNRRQIIGLHPSYYSSTEHGGIHREQLRLKNDLKQEVVYSRQHFLKFNIRTTPQQLIQAGILADFSMGFSDTAGFRAGTSFPFRYYDFQNEKSTELCIVPFCVMDGAYSIHQLLSHEAVLKEMAGMAEDIKKCGGLFTCVFHERSFYDHLYPGFGTLYKELHLQIKARFNT